MDNKVAITCMYNQCCVYINWNDYVCIMNILKIIKRNKYNLNNYVCDLDFSGPQIHFESYYPLAGGSIMKGV